MEREKPTRVYKYPCAHCHDIFESPKRLSATRRYCGYCAAVHLGAPDDRWLPKIGGDELKELQRTRGASITRRQD